MTLKAVQHKIVWRGPRALMESGSYFLTEVRDDLAVAVALVKLETDDEAWALEAYVTGEPMAGLDLDVALSAFEPKWPSVAPGIVEAVPEKDWVKHALSGLGIVEAGPFVLYGVHDADKINENDDTIAIRIDANQAFGTGHHPTTAGCLTLLGRFAGFAPKSILDLGCGSGVLAIAAAKLWGRTVIASDLDAGSVAIARENTTLNDVSEQVAVIEAAGFDHPSINDAAPFDFIFANILAGPLKELAPRAADLTVRNGRIMVAGLMAEQEDDVRMAYEAVGFREINRLDHAVWPVLLFVRESDGRV